MPQTGAFASNKQSISPFSRVSRVRARNNTHTIFCFLLFYSILFCALLVRSNVPLTFGFLKIGIDKQTIFDLLSTKNNVIPSIQQLYQLTQINTPLFFKYRTAEQARINLQPNYLFDKPPYASLARTLSLIFFPFLFFSLCTFRIQNRGFSMQMDVK